MELLSEFRPLICTSFKSWSDPFPSSSFSCFQFQSRQRSWILLFPERRHFVSSSALPTAAERLVEVHDRDELVALALGEGILCRVELLLRLQHLDVIREARLVASERQPYGFLERGYLRLLRRALLGEARLRRQRVRDLAE